MDEKKARGITVSLLLNLNKINKIVEKFDRNTYAAKQVFFFFFFFLNAEFYSKSNKFMQPPGHMITCAVDP